MTNFKKMFLFLRPYMFLYCIGMFLYNFQTFAFSIAIGLLGSNVMAGVMAGDTGEIIRGTIIAVSILAVLFSLVGLGMYLVGIALLKAELDLKQKLFRRFMHSSLESSGHSGEGIAAINTEANTAMGVWESALSGLLRPVLGISLSLVTIFIVEWRLGFAAVILGLLAYIMQSRFVKPLAAIGKERLNANADAVKAVSDIFQGALPLRALNMQDRILENASKNIVRLKLLNFRQAFMAMWQRLFTTVQGWLALVIVFGFGGWLVATQGLYFPVLLLILPLVQNISEEMGNVGQAIAGLQPPLVAAERILAIIDNVPTSQNKGIMAFDGSSLKTQGLNFKYQDVDQNTLQDINLDISPCEMVAFVGPSGSGKSTLLRIMAGFYEREQLGLSLGGISFDAVNIVEWRKQFAYVDQSCKLFDMTVKENIALGRKDNVSDTDIIGAAKKAFAHDFIEELENKYDAPCGELGSSLSGGQKQRIAIARALIKGSPILVFDEATSALDVDSERYVMDTIESLRRDHTILITTHNLNNIATADKIVVMDGGRIAETGKHEELMANGGLYSRLLAAE
ncbi:MAG: ABC transporter ATP-binding protein/permease [Firmicutes bacterium]|nr:ABC transporter ATP-binding protein/permease [Bacillota bacterium]